MVGQLLQVFTFGVDDALGRLGSAVMQHHVGSMGQNVARAFDYTFHFVHDLSYNYQIVSNEIAMYGITAIDRRTERRRCLEETEVKRPMQGSRRCSDPQRQGFFRLKIDKTAKTSVFSLNNGQRGDGKCRRPHTVRLWLNTCRTARG